MTQESQDGDPDLWAARRFSSYRDYIAAFEADDPAFYGALDRRAQADAPSDQQTAWLREALAERDAALAETRRQLDQANHRLHTAKREAEGNRGGWRLPFGKS